MNEAEYKALTARVELGESLSALEQFRYDAERRRRAEPPNALQQIGAERRENPLLKAPMWGKAGISRPGKQEDT